MKKTLVYMLVLCFGIGIGISVLGCGGAEKKTTPAPKTGTSDTTKTPAEKPK